MKEKMYFLKYLMLFLISFALSAKITYAQTISYVKVIDGETTIPLVPELKAFSIPAISNGFVSFRGNGIGYEGIFHTNARSFTKLADNDTVIPETSDTFSYLGLPAFDSLRGSFLGVGKSGVAGIYTSFGGPLPSKVAAVNDPVPGSSSTYRGFNDSSVDFDPVGEEGQVVFWAKRMDSGHGIYSYGLGENSSADVIADTSTAMPGSFDIFNYFGDPVIDSATVVFRATGMFGSQGIYKHESNSLSVVANNLTWIPSGLGAFISFGDQYDQYVVSTGDGDVAFRGNGFLGQQGIYAHIGGTLHVIADRNTAVPGGTGNFFSFPDYPPSISNANVAFIGIDQSQHSALYAGSTIRLARVIGENDELDGRYVSALKIGPQALDDKFLAFHVTFTDNSEAIYLAAFDIADAGQADLNNDGVVDFQDFRAVLIALGPCPPSEACPEDLDGDGEVTIRDLLEVVGNRGPVSGGPPVNDECQNAISVGEGKSGPFFVPFSTLGATTSTNLTLQAGIVKNYNGLDCDEGEGLEMYNDVWFRYKPPATCGGIRVSTCGFADFDTRLALYVQNFYDSTGDCGQLELLACNDDSPGCSTTSDMAFGPYICSHHNLLCTDVEEYWIRVGSKNPFGSGSGNLLVSCEPPQFDVPDTTGEEPESCKPLLCCDIETGHALWIDNFTETVPTSFDDTPGCGDGDSIDLWYCITAAQTGVMSASLTKVIAAPNCDKRPPDFFTISVFNDTGTKMIACSENNTPQGIRIDESGKCLIYMNSEIVHWGAVTGNRYLVRVGAPTIDIQYDLQVKYEDPNTCGWPFTGTCFFDNYGVPGCDDGRCCTLVCESDPYCCNVEWDEYCAHQAQSLCDQSQLLCEGTFSEESCYTVHGSAGCKVSDCCEAVCQTDPICCDVEWDLECVRRAASLCTSPPCPLQSGGSCFDTSVDIGCSDYACCGKVCDADPRCCSSSWDSQCVTLARNLCRQ